MTTLLYAITMTTIFAQQGKMTTVPPSSGTVSVIPNLSPDERAMPKYPLGESSFLQEINPNFPLEENNVDTKGISVNVGRNFGANNMAGGTPMDNTIAISNGGFIISADNRQVDYYTENGDTIKQFTEEHPVFYDLSGFTLNNVFDPKVIYDRYNDRFILAAIDHRKSGNSCIYLSFSKNNTPSDSASWNHYKLPIDSTHFDSLKTFWYDYINIAVNKDELFITSNVFEYFPTTEESHFVGNVLWQINKQEGYDSLALICRKFIDITQTDGEIAFTLVPLSESLQSDSYNSGCYLVNNENVFGDSLYWYHLTGNIPTPSTTISKHSLHTTSYQYVPYSSQPGSAEGDRIWNGDCRIRSGYYQNGKLHFVYVRNNLDWGQIVYSRINTNSNTEQRNTWGIANKNYLYPSIASFSNDTITEDALICFNRVGPNEYPQICVVNYENGWSNNSTVVKDGEGILDWIPYLGSFKTYERLGDYTGIQRRYNEKACWLVASYAFGDTINLGGETNFLNAWIAEVGDRGVGIEELESSSLSIYPTPVTAGQGFKLVLNTTQNISEITVVNTLGKSIEFNQNGNTIMLLDANKGMYFITLKTDKNEIFTHKILLQ